MSLVVSGGDVSEGALAWAQPVPGIFSTASGMAATFWFKAPAWIGSEIIGLAAETTKQTPWFSTLREVAVTGGVLATAMLALAGMVLPGAVVV